MKRLSVTSLAIAATSLALVALLLYSLERTTWLFAQFETDKTAATGAAIVVELAAVALIVSASALSRLDGHARAYANRALIVVLAVSALANLTAGFLRGGRDLPDLFASGDDLATYAVAAPLLLVTNLAVPALVFFLSKLLERLVASRVQGRTRLAQRRALVRRLCAALRAARATSAQAVQVERDRLDEVARLTAQVAQLEQEVARLTAQVAQAQATAVQVDRALAQARAESARLAQEVEQAAQAGALDLLAIARALREVQPVSWRTIEDLLKTPASTLRSRVERTAERNGHGAH